MNRKEILDQISQIESRLAQMDSEGGEYEGGQRFIITPDIPGVKITDMAAEIAQKRAGQMFPSATERAKGAEQEMFGGRIEMMTDLFDKAYPFTREATALKPMEEMFGDSAMYDKAIGAEVGARKMFGAYPKTPVEGEPGWSDVMAYEDMSEGFLTTLAKQAGEQRPTNQDISRFKKSLMSFGNDPRRNEILKQALQRDLQTLSPRDFLYKHTQNPMYAPRKKINANQIP